MAAAVQVSYSNMMELLGPKCKDSLKTPVGTLL